MGEWKVRPIYPFAKVWWTNYNPEGGNKAVEQLIDAAVPQMTAILQSGTRMIGIAPDQISRYVDYVPPASPGQFARAYADSLSAKYGGLTLSGFGDTPDISQMFEESAKAAAKEAVIKGVVSSVPGAVPFTGTITQAASIIQNPEALKTTAGRTSAGFSLASALPGIGIAVGVVAAAIAISNLIKGKEHAEAEAKRGEELMKSVESYITATIEEAKMLAQAVALRGGQLLDAPDPAYQQAAYAHYCKLAFVIKEDANAEVRKKIEEKMIAYWTSLCVWATWQETKMVTVRSGLSSVVKRVTTTESGPIYKEGGVVTQNLAFGKKKIVVKGPLLNSATGQEVTAAPSTREITPADITQEMKDHTFRNVGLGPAQYHSWALLMKEGIPEDPTLTIVEIGMGRHDKLRLFLQFARDMRKTREAIETRIPIVAASGKPADQAVYETAGLAERIVQNNPEVPYQQAAAAAAAVSTKNPQTISPEMQQRLTAKVTETLEADKKSKGWLIGLGVAGLILKGLA